LTGGSPVPLWVGTPAAVGLYPEIDAVCIVPTLAGPQLAAPMPAPGASAPKP
jgi:hypothetical protein